MRDILDILKAETSKFPGAHSRMIVSTGMQVLTRARDEITQLRAKLKTCRADAMEECAEILDIKFTPQAVETEFWRGWNAALAEGAAAIRQRKDKADG